MLNRPIANSPAVLPISDVLCIQAKKLPDSFANVTVGSEIGSEVVIIQGFGTGKASPELIRSLATVLGARLDATTSAYSLLRDAKQKLVLDQSARILFKKSFQKEEEGIQRLEEEYHAKMGTPRFAYGYFAGYADEISNNRNENRTGSDLLRPRSAVPARVLLTQFLSSANEKGDKLNWAPFQASNYCNATVPGYDPLPVDLTSNLNLYREAQANFNKYIQAKGQPKELSKLYPPVKDGSGMTHPSPAAEMSYFRQVPALTNNPLVALITLARDDSFFAGIQLYDELGKYVDSASIDVPIAPAGLTESDIPVGADPLRLSPEAKEYLDLIAHNPWLTEKYTVNQEAIKTNRDANENFITPKSQLGMNPLYFKPVEKDPLSTFATEMVQCLANAVGCSKIVGDLPDALLSEGGDALEANPFLTPRAILKVLQKAGVNAIKSGDTLLVQPELPLSVTAGRVNRSALQHGYQTLIQEKNLTVRQYAQLIWSLYRPADNFNKACDDLLLPVRNQMNLVGTTPLPEDVNTLLVLGALSDSQWENLSRGVTIFTNHDPALEQVAISYYGRISFAALIKNGTLNDFSSSGNRLVAYLAGQTGASLPIQAHVTRTLSLNLGMRPTSSAGSSPQGDLPPLPDNWRDYCTPESQQNLWKFWQPRDEVMGIHNDKADKFWLETSSLTLDEVDSFHFACDYGNGIKATASDSLAYSSPNYSVIKLPPELERFLMDPDPKAAFSSGSGN